MAQDKEFCLGNLSVSVNQMCSLPKDGQTSDNQTDHESLHIRRIVAGNPNTPAEVLRRLASDDDSTVRLAVAENPRTPSELLHILARDNEPSVRLAISENSRISRETLSLIVKDDDVDVRYGLAENHQMPDEILLALAIDENPYVSCRAIKTIERLSPAAQVRMRSLISQALMPFRFAI